MRVRIFRTLVVFFRLLYQNVAKDVEKDKLLSVNCHKSNKLLLK